MKLIKLLTYIKSLNKKRKYLKIFFCHELYHLNIPYTYLHIKTIMHCMKFIYKKGIMHMVLI